MKLSMLLSVVMLLASLSQAQVKVGFDFRNTMDFVRDDQGNLPVLATTSYPLQASGFTFGWTNINLVQGRDFAPKNDPRLAGANIINNGAPATFVVDLPSAGMYNFSMALGYAGYSSCWSKCEIQLKDGATLVGDFLASNIPPQYFQDGTGAQWTNLTWPASNRSVPIAMVGTKLSVIVGTAQATGDSTDLAFIGLAQGGPPQGGWQFVRTLTMPQGGSDYTDLTFTPVAGYQGDVTLSLSTDPLPPPGVSVAIMPITIPNGSGVSRITATADGLVDPGNYPIVIIAQGNGVRNTMPLSISIVAVQ